MPKRGALPVRPCCDAGFLGVVPEGLSVSRGRGRGLPIVQEALSELTVVGSRQGVERGGSSARPCRKDLCKQAGPVGQNLLTETPGRRTRTVGLRDGWRSPERPGGDRAVPAWAGAV